MASHVDKARVGAWAIAAALLLSAFGVQAQVQRSFINLGFEQPALGVGNCFIITSSADVPGWETTHSVYPRSGNCTIPVGSAGPSIELWRSLNGVNPRAGINHAELNAHENSRIYQSVCLANGEVVDWRLSHRGRGGTDVMSFNINSIADQIVRASTTEAGVGTVVAGSCGTGNVGGANCNSPTTVNSWADYSGSFVWNGATGTHTFGFEAISTGSGNTASGNFLDEIVVILRPYLEFFPAAAVTREDQGGDGVPSLRVTGIIENSFDVQVAITGGTAVLGTHFTAPGATFTVTIAAGDYGTGQDFPLPLSAIDNAVVEDNRTVTFAIVENPGDYVVGSTSTCGGAANAVLTWTIVDNDVDLLTTKAVDPSTVPAGEAFEYTVTFANNTARPTVAPLDAHDATAEVSDVLPAGLAFDSWTCQASNGASCPGGAPDGSTNGSGAISGSAFLPAGGGAAGGQLVYTIEASFVDPQNCDAVTNTATIATPPDLQEGETADPGFVTPLPGGSANNSASVDVQVACADLQIEKSVSPDDVAPGDEVLYTLLVTNNGPQAADGALVTDPGVPDSLECTALACSTTGGAVCPASPTPTQLAAGLAIPTFPVDGVVTLELTCTVTATGN